MTCMTVWDPQVSLTSWKGVRENLCWGTVHHCIPVNNISVSILGERLVS
jgi:hypothetical protein